MTYFIVKWMRNKNVKNANKLRTGMAITERRDARVDHFQMSVGVGMKYMTYATTLFIIIICECSMFTIASSWLKSGEKKTVNFGAGNPIRHSDGNLDMRKIVIKMGTWSFIFHNGKLFHNYSRHTYLCTYVHIICMI